jgi:hypothetical protein
MRSNSWVGYGEQAMVDSVCESSSGEESWAIVGEEVPRAGQFIWCPVIDAR